MDRKVVAIGDSGTGEFLTGLIYSYLGLFRKL